MRFKIILAVFAIFIVICFANPKGKPRTCGKRKVFQGNSWNGEPVGPNSWPWLVAFRFKSNGKLFCGGSLVSARHVVSAAHCFHKKDKVTKTEPHEITAIVGKHDLRIEAESGSVEHDVLDIFLHKDWDYNEDGYNADISIVLLEIEVDLSQRRYARIVCLPPASASEPNGNGTVAGWGFSKWSDVNGLKHALTPSELDMPIVSKSECLRAEKLFHFIASNQTFCAGFLNQNKAVCQGDSGGGFYKFDESKAAYDLTGIVSSSLKDPKMNPCRTDTYSVFTDVSKFIDWIQMKIKDTMELKWEMEDFDCEHKKYDVRNVLYCSPEFTGPYTRYSKFREHFSIADIDELKINFGSSDFIFAGIDESFPKLKKLEIRGNIKVIEKRNFVAMEKLEKLDLEKNKIELLTENVFSGLVNLKELDLDNNQIQILPEKVFSDLVNLKELRLNRNQIRNLPEKVFSGLENLKELYLFSNQIQNLPEKVFSGLENLKELRLNRNQIRNLPEKVFSGLENLKELYLFSNQIQNLPEKVFSGLENLKKLSLDGNQIQNLPEKVFSGLVNLKKLRLNSNQIRNLPEKVFSGLVNLNELELHSNQIRNFPEKVFSGLVNLKELDLDNNQIQNLPEKVFSDLVNLKELRLNRNQIRNLPEKVFSGLVKLEALLFYKNPSKTDNVDFSMNPNIRIYN